MNLKVGDEVTIRKDLNTNMMSSTAIGVVSQMLIYAGKKTKITEVSDYKGKPKYRLRIDNASWNWTDDFLYKKLTWKEIIENLK